MDPLSIVASAIAVFQAADRLGSLLGSIKPFLNAPNDVAALLNEVHIIRNSLSELQATATIDISAPPKHPPRLHGAIAVCLQHVSQLEHLISKACQFEEKSNGVVLADVKRLVWVRKKGEMEMVKLRLRDAISALQLAISSLNLSSQVRLSISVENLGHILQEFQTSLEIPSPHLLKLIESSGPSLNSDTCRIPGIDSKQRQATEVACHALPGLSPWADNASEASTSRGTSDSLNKNRESTSSLSAGPTLETTCCCQQSGSRTLSVLTGVLGILLIEWTGQPLGQTECDVENCTKKTVPSVSITYYGPSWIFNLATRFSLRMSSPPSVSLTFPRILPPDAEIFVSIRVGNANRLRDLLIEGRASVADVLAPYGISTLLLANLHGQTEIAQLLLSAGASRVPPVNIDCPGIHMHRFWSNYSSQDCRILSSEILCDYLYQHSSPHSRGSPGLGYHTITDKSFTRLHKCILGLTCETIETVLPTCTDEIDAVDSLARSALHLASYQGNSKAIQLLLAQGANPDIKDQYGKSPLHIVAALGSYSATKALIDGGADLEVRDQFESTPLHHASIMGYHNIVELLVDSGSDIDATTCHLETPIRQAILTDRIEVVQFLHQRGAALTLEDNCTTYALQKSVWFNAHRVLRYLLNLQLRVDQRHMSRGTILHTMAANGDALTMSIFLEVKHSSLAKLNETEVDSRGWTAMDYLECRKNVDELRDPFRRVLDHVRIARQRSATVSFELFDLMKDSFQRIQEVEEDDVFSDALEIQVQV